MARIYSSFSYIYIYLFFLVNLIGKSKEQSECTTPKKVTGNCININQCPKLLYLLNADPFTAENLLFLQQSNCGYVGNMPKVCCAPEDMNLLPNLEDCGTDTTNRILGGEVTEIDEFPWMALLEYKTDTKRGFFCGGVLINPKYVLTAAHCVVGKDIPKTWSLVSVRLGEYDTSKNVDCTENEDGQQDCANPVVDIPIEENVVHDFYDSASVEQYHDIALIRLSKPVSYSDFIRPICLPASDAALPPGRAYVAGWGKTETRSASSVKLKVQVPFVNRTACASIYKKVAVSLGSGHICAGGLKGKDSCRGDSGGPLMHLNNSNWYAVGVVSFGQTPCGVQGWPGVYTKVSDYVEWITKNIRV